MSKNNDIDQQLRDAIQASGLSLYQLGQNAGINDSQLSRFMRGERDLRLHNAARLCRVLGLRLVADATQTKTPPPSAKPKRTRKRGE